MMGTGVTLREYTERKPQSERVALMARAAIQWRLVKAMVGAYQEIGRQPITNENQEVWKSKRVTARGYLALWAKTRNLIRSLPE